MVAVATFADAQTHGNQGEAAKIRAAFDASKRRYGSPRIHVELGAQGERVTEKTVAKLMREDGVMARAKRRFRATTDSKHDDPIAEPSGHISPIAFELRRQSEAVAA